MDITKHFPTFIITATFLLSLVAAPNDGWAQAFKPPAQSLLGTWAGEVDVLTVTDETFVAVGENEFMTVDGMPVLLKGDLRVTISDRKSVV